MANTYADWEKALFEKIARTLRSCKTAEQKQVANKYIELAKKKVLNTKKSPFSKKIISDLFDLAISEIRLNNHLFLLKKVTNTFSETVERHLNGDKE